MSPVCGFFPEDKKTLVRLLKHRKQQLKRGGKKEEYGARRCRGWAMILRTSKGKGNVDEEEARYLLPACGNVFKTKRGLRLQSVMLPKI